MRGRTVAILGLTFKPDTDDIRESPAIPIITALQDAGARIRAHDPEGMTHAEAALTGVTYCGDAHEAADGADAVVIVTDWPVFRNLDLPRLRRTMATPVMVDLRNVYDAATVTAAGIEYTGVGQGDVPDGSSMLLYQAAE